jgi:four helix bundle protein
MEAQMSANILKEKSEAFGDRVIACCGVLKTRQASPSLVEQLLRAGTSVGANIAEAQFAHGKKDFVAKLEIALKETSEAEFWLSRLLNSNCLTEREFKSMRSDCIAIRKLLVASIVTVKNKLNSEKTKQ